MKKTIKSAFNHEFSETYKKILNFKEENENYRFEWESRTGSSITIPFVTSELISKKIYNNKKVVNYEIKCDWASYKTEKFEFKETTIAKIEISSVYNEDTKSFIINNISYNSLVEENSGVCYQ